MSPSLMLPLTPNMGFIYFYPSTNIQSMRTISPVKYACLLLVAKVNLKNTLKTEQNSLHPIVLFLMFKQSILALNFSLPFYVFLLIYLPISELLTVTTKIRHSNWPGNCHSTVMLKLQEMIIHYFQNIFCYQKIGKEDHAWQQLLHSCHGSIYIVKLQQKRCRSRK